MMALAFPALTRLSWLRCPPLNYIMKCVGVGSETKTPSAILRHHMLSDYTTSTNLQTPNLASPSYIPLQVQDHAKTDKQMPKRPCTPKIVPFHFFYFFFNSFYEAINSWSLPCTDMNNNRYQCLRFSIGCNSVLHGFAGYFEATLYKDVMLSKYFVAAAFVAHNSWVSITKF